MGGNTGSKMIMGACALYLLVCMALPARAQAPAAEPCPPTLARRNRPQLSLTLDSLRLAALRPADACQAWAAGTYRRRRLLALAGPGGQLQDTLGLRPDSAPVLYLPVEGGVLALRAGLLEGGLVYQRYRTEPRVGIAAEPSAELALAGIEGIDMVPRGPENPAGISLEEAKAYAKVTFWLRAAGSQPGSLVLLLQRKEALCKPGSATNGLYDYRWLLLTLPTNALGLPQRSGALVQAVPAALCPAPPAANAFAPPPPEELHPLHPHQPAVPDGAGGWIVSTGQALVRATPQGCQALLLPKGTQPSQAWAEGQVGSAPPQLYLRTGGVLRQADEDKRFRLREVWVATGVVTLPLARLSPDLALKRLPRLSLPDEAVMAGIPLAYWQGRWWLAGRQQAAPPQAKPAFGR